jgi:hypothetical protein
MKLRSSKKVHFENENVNDVDVDEEEDDDVYYTLAEREEEDETIYSLEADDSLIEDNKIWFVVLIMTLFSINYLYGCIANNSTSTDFIYW